MSNDNSKKDKWIKLLRLPLSRSSLKKVLKALPSIIPYFGNAYSYITTDSQLDTINENIETILLELKGDISDNFYKMNEIINQINAHRNPDFILNSSSYSNGDIEKHFLNFTISNTGGSIIHVRKIWLNLVSTKKCEHISQSQLGALMDEYKYRVNLTPKIKDYLIEDRSFYYKCGDIDKFTLTICGQPMFYYVQICVEYSDVRYNVWKIIKSPIHRLQFNIIWAYAETLSLLKIYKVYPELLTREKKFRNHPEFIDYFKQNHHMFTEYPNLFVFFIKNPKLFIDIGIDTK